MVAPAKMVAKAMKPVDIHALGHSADTMPQAKVEHATTRPPNKPKAGSSPQASMHDGPYGGKKPQG